MSRGTHCGTKKPIAFPSVQDNLLSPGSGGWRAIVFLLLKPLSDLLCPTFCFLPEIVVPSLALPPVSSSVPSSSTSRVFVCVCASMMYDCVRVCRLVRASSCLCTMTCKGTPGHVLVAQDAPLYLLAWVDACSGRTGRSVPCSTSKAALSKILRSQTVKDSIVVLRPLTVPFFSFLASTEDCSRDYSPYDLLRTCVPSCLNPTKW